MRITSKGQVTIPIDIREKAGLLPATEVEFHYDGKVVTIRPVSNPNGVTRGERLVAHLQKFRDRATMSADEVMKLTRGE